MYVYQLPCGHSFYSTTPSIPVLSTLTDELWHWLPCSCGRMCVLTQAELAEAEQPPRMLNGTRYSDNKVGIAVDEALKRERVMNALRIWRYAVPYRVIAEWCGVSVGLVERVARLYLRGEREE